MGVMKRDGLVLENGKIVQKELYYQDRDVDNHAMGFPINCDVALMMIKDLWDELKKPVTVVDPNDYMKKPIAFTVGKKALLSILSQENCIGVRFYLANYKDSFFDKYTPRPGEKKDGLTIIAVGVEKNNSCELDNLEDKDIGTKNGERYIVTQLANDQYNNGEYKMSVEPGEINEMVPPLTIEDFKGKVRGDKGLDFMQYSLADVIDKFFS